MATCKPPGGDQAFTKAKDESIKNLLEVADEQDINFDPKKCPITKYDLLILIYVILHLILKGIRR